jgi:hypothetical protein
MLLIVGNLNAQTGWYPNAGAVPVTPDNIGIGTAVGVTPNARLEIASTFAIQGGTLYNPIVVIGQTPPPPPPATPCTLVGQPAISINWGPLNGPTMASIGQQLCSNTITPPNAFEIYGWNNNGLSNNKVIAFEVGSAGNVGIGTASTTNNSLTVGNSTLLNGPALLKGNTQLTRKLRINSGTLTTMDWTITNFPYSFSVDNGNSRFLGKVQIGSLKPTTTYSNYALAVDGDIVCKKQVVQINDWADYVFATDYKLMPLQELEAFVATNKHLPNIPAEEVIIKEGLDVGEMQKLQQAKIEELTLYIIQLQKRLDVLENTTKK